MTDDQPTVTLTVPGEPRSKARPRFTTRGGKVVAYTPKATVNAEAQYRDAYLTAAGEPNRDAFGAYAVHADFYNGTYQRRDVDNMLKAVLDGLNGIAWDDDAQVVEVIGRKHYVEKAEARAEVRIYARGPLRGTNIACPVCGDPIKTYASTRARGGNTYCSQACHLEARRQARLRTCPNCGKTFESHNVKSPAKYCSKECSYQGRRTTLPCTRCGTLTSVQKCHADKAVHCSDECRRATAAERKRQGPKRARGTCTVCGGPVSRPEYKRCAGCRDAGAKAWGRPAPA